MSDTSEIIDVHSHSLQPVWLAAVAEATGVDPSQVVMDDIRLPPWSPELHVEFMDRIGVSVCMLSQPTGTAMMRGRAARDLARAMNEDLAATIAAYPRRLGGFAVVPMDDIDAAVAETAYALDVLGLDGVACPAQTDGVYLGEPVYDPWFAAMNDRRATLFMHPGAPAGLDLVDIGLPASTLEFMFDTTRAVTNLVISGARTRYPDVAVIATHGGGTIPFIAARIASAEPYFGPGKGRPTLTREEVEAGLASFHFDLTATTSPAALAAIRRLVPAEQLMLGFDFPFMPETLAKPAIAEFEQHGGFGNEERDLIRSKNALRLFPRLAARRTVAAANISGHPAN